ncbi:transglycosylase family protein [Luteipulveratus sp. YIM 133132]|uniref:transglycosylase family protein n=1 Tax=Luteipulveratus flavus TaxID=3031728 RepID=UPI0023B16518|nr:transglycosylase family protein [Luteipulveratus sp. YIM 133132]MDE9366365.1 transglycosylase family protein [Luteipulveratus sp. YIM 133132]
MNKHVRRTIATIGTATVLVGGGAAVASSAHADTGVPVLEAIKQCESGGDYTAQNPSSSASGAYQFLTSTWQSLNASQGYATAASAPASVQDAAALELYQAQGTSPWAASSSCWSKASGSSTVTNASTGSTGSSTTTNASTATNASSGSSSTATGTSASDSSSSSRTSTSTKADERGSGHAASRASRSDATDPARHAAAAHRAPVKQDARAGAQHAHGGEVQQDCAR